MTLNSASTRFFRMYAAIISRAHPLLIWVKFFFGSWGVLCFYYHVFALLFLGGWVSLLCFFGEAWRSQAVDSFDYDVFFAVLRHDLTGALFRARSCGKYLFYFSFDDNGRRVFDGDTQQRIFIFDLLNVFIFNKNCISWVILEFFDSIKNIHFKLLFISLITLSLGQSHIGFKF